MFSGLSSSANNEQCLRSTEVLIAFCISLHMYWFLLTQFVLDQKPKSCSRRSLSLLCRLECWVKLECLRGEKYMHYCNEVNEFEVMQAVCANTWWLISKNIYIYIYDLAHHLTFASPAEVDSGPGVEFACRISLSEKWSILLSTYTEVPLGQSRPKPEQALEQGPSPVRSPKLNNKPVC